MQRRKRPSTSITLKSSYAKANYQSIGQDFINKKTTEQRRKEAVQLYSAKVRELNAHKLGQQSRARSIRQQSPGHSRERCPLLQTSSPREHCHRRDTSLNHNEERGAKGATSYTLLQAHQNRYTASAQNTRRSQGSNFGNIKRLRQHYTSRELLSSSSNSRSPTARLHMKHNPLNRHSTPNSYCTQTAATTVEQRRESAQKLLKAVQTSEGRVARRSLSSIRSGQHQSIELNSMTRGEEYQLQSFDQRPARYNSHVDSVNSRTGTFTQKKLRMQSPTERFRSKSRSSMQNSNSSLGYKHSAQPKRCLTAHRISQSSFTQCRRVKQQQQQKQKQKQQKPKQIDESLTNILEPGLSVQEDDDEVSEKPYYTVQGLQQSPRMSDLQEVDEDERKLGEGIVSFEPSEFYVHEVLKFKVKHASMRDKVQSFNQATSFWEVDDFLHNCYRKYQAPDKSREGRKLKIAEYYKKMQCKPFKPKTRHIIPDYVVPSDKKREAVRYNIRMKMHFASGIQFPSTLDAQDKKRKVNQNARVASKVTEQAIADINKSILLNADTIV